jgi:acyl-CoA thioester hydrolase
LVILVSTALVLSSAICIVPSQPIKNMETYFKTPEIRWSDLDPNFHLRHSVYYDWGATVRISFMNEHSITPATMQQLHIGPIVFREEAVFKREIKFGDAIRVHLQLAKCNADYSRWTMIHEIWKNNDTLAAILTIDGAWMDTAIRKLAVPPDLFQAGFEIIPKTSDFVML